jgi:hypothetical protein
MEYTNHCGAFAVCNDRTVPVANGIGAKLARLARRLTHALVVPRQGEVDRKIAGIVAHSGGRITDSMEREIMRKALVSDWSLPQ